MIEVRLERQGRYYAMSPSVPATKRLLMVAQNSAGVTAHGEILVMENQQEFLADAAGGRAIYDLGQGRAVSRRIPNAVFLKWMPSDVRELYLNPKPPESPAEEKPS